MATNPTAEFWIRTDGDDSNGGGYDSGRIGATTNYCDQAGAQATWSSCLSLTSGTLTDTSASNQFTADMIGNSVQVIGNGYYWIIGFTDANTVSIDGFGASSFSNISGKVGGAFRNQSNLSNGGSVSSPTTSSPLSAGNKVHMRASGSGSVGSPDYPQIGYATYAYGDTTSGYIEWIGYNGVPYLSSDGLRIYNSYLTKWRGLYMYATSTNPFPDGVLFSSGACAIDNCTIDANGQVGLGGIVTGATGGATTQGLIISNSIIKGGGSASGSGIVLSIYGLEIINSLITNFGGHGIDATNGTGAMSYHIINSVISNNFGRGLSLSNNNTIPSQLINCDIDGNASDGIRFDDSVQILKLGIMINNNITNNGGYGMNGNVGTTATNDQMKMLMDYNNVYNNTSGNYNNISAGPNDLSVNPNYAGSGHYTPSNIALVAAAPIPFA